MCRYGQGVVRAIFEEFDAENLKGFTAWLPTMGGDNAEAVRVESEAFGDRQMFFAWDPESRLGELFTKALKLRRTPWDVYFLYAPGVRWEGDEPPQPTFWMHQHPVDYGVDPKLLLNPGRLSEEVRRLLGKGGEPSDSDLPLNLHYKALLWLTRERVRYSVEEIKDGAQGSKQDGSPN